MISTAMKILVVNENRAEADWIANLLNSDIGCRTLPLYSPSEALRHAKHITFDVAFVGGSPGDALGAKIAEKLLAFMPRCKVVVMVPQVVIPDMKFLWRDFDYIAVPFEAEDLLKKVNEIRDEQSLDELRALLDKIRMERFPDLDTGEKLGQGDFEGFGNFLDVDQRDVPLATFYAANVSSVQFANSANSSRKAPESLALAGTQARRWVGCAVHYRARAFGVGRKP